MEEVQSDQFNSEDDNEFYEKIEAPKFVDFTLPELCLPDDRSWFCLRVGCDQKHEEDMDPDALYKSFVLRVMAARSPNLRLRRALSRQVPSAYMKCPHSAPAKSSKPRISRLTAITSISQKMADIKVKVRPLSKVNSTPNGKAKDSSVAEKALTTPRYKKCLPKDPFRSVQNSKTTVTMTKNRVVAKALVFDPPKKTGRTTTTLECQTPMKDICSGMKKLRISSQRKQVLGQSSKPLRCTARGPNKSVTASGLKSPLHTHKSKSQLEVSRDCKDQEAKSLRRLKRKGDGNLQKCHGPVLQEGVDNDSSDMEIDGKSRNVSLEVSSASGSSRSNKGKGHEECPIAVITNFGATNATQEKSPIGENMQPMLTDASSYREASSLSNSEKDIEEKDPPTYQTSNGEGDESNEGNEHEENIGSTSEEEKDSEEKEDVPRFRTPKGAGDESKATESDDKENASASDDNRESNINSDNSQRKIHQHEARENHQKVIGALGKTFKGGSTVAATGSHGGKYKKTKPTNPKPFRLRTDERGILREANLERRLLAPLKEITPVSRFPGGNSQRNHGNEIQRDKKSHGQCKHKNDSQEGNQIESEKSVQKVQPQRTRPTYLKTSKCAVEPKMATTSTQRQKKFEDGKEKAAQKLESGTTAKSHLSQQQLVRPQRVAGTTKAKVSLVSPVQLSVIRETSSTVSRPKEAANTMKSGITTTTTTINVDAGGRSSSRGRRPATIPKEPNFHRIHTPKSCTKTPCKAIS